LTGHFGQLLNGTWQERERKEIDRPLSGSIQMGYVVGTRNREERRERKLTSHFWGSSSKLSGPGKKIVTWLNLKFHSPSFLQNQSLNNLGSISNLIKHKNNN
jgi:hypothetical protein